MKTLPTLLILALFVGNVFAEDVGLYCESSEIKESAYTLKNGKIKNSKPFEIKTGYKQKFLILNSANKTIEIIHTGSSRSIKKVSVSDKGLNEYEWSLIFNVLNSEDKTYDNFMNSPKYFDTAFVYSINRVNLELRVNRFSHNSSLNYDGFAYGMEFMETYQCEIDNEKVFEEKESALARQKEQKSKNKI